MITNVFRLGGFQQLSWFELGPDWGNPPGRLRKEKESWENTIALTLSAHLSLQEEGKLSAWICYPASKESSSQQPSFTNEHVKLWLFLPGCHDTGSASAKAAHHGLRVVRTGLWCLPGESDEVSAALTQAILNRLERSMRNLAYVRFGDVFVKCKQAHISDPRLYGDGIVTCEFVFAASEEGIFAHTLLRQKRVRRIENEDLKKALAQHVDSSLPHEFSLPVVVAPYGLSGRLTGCCPSSLVDRLKKSKLQAANGQVASSLPFPNCSFPTPNGSTLFSGTGKAWVYAGYPEVCLGPCPEFLLQGTAMDSAVTNASYQSFELDGHQIHGQHNCGGKTTSDNAQKMRRVYIFPAEAVLTPMTPKIPPQIYHKRAWLNNWAGVKWLEESTVPGIMNLASLVYWNGGDHHKMQQSKRHQACSKLKHAKSSSCSSSSSSEGDVSAESTSSSSSSSSGSSSSDGECEIATFDKALKPGGSPTSKVDEAVGKKSSRRSASTNDGSSQPSENALLQRKGFQGLKRGRSKAGRLTESPLKLSRRGSMEDVSAVFEGASENVLGTPAEFHVSSSVGGGMPVAPGSQAGTPWDWADDDRGLAMDMQNEADMLAEFGDFGDFFEDDDVLGLGEPPGTAESQALFSFGNCGDGVNTPGTVCIDTSDPLLLPILDFPSVEGPSENGFGRDQGLLGLSGEMKINGEGPGTARSLTPVHPQSIMSGELALLPKAEASIIFAPEFAAVETTVAGNHFKEPLLSKQAYCPENVKDVLRSTKTNGYIYCATPPPTSKSSVQDNGAEHGRSDTYSRRGNNEAGSVLVEDGSCVEVAAKKFSPSRWQTCGTHSVGTGAQVDMMSGSAFQSSNSSKYVASTAPSRRLFVAQLATDLNCAFLQLQHQCDMYLDPSESILEANSGSAKNQSATVESSEITAHADGESEKSSKRSLQEKKKKESIPSRIAGDIEEDIHDAHKATQVGVWRPVETPKVQKGVTSGTFTRQGSVGTATDRLNVGPEESCQGGLSRQNQLREYAEAVPLLAQQAAAAVDIVLDGEFGDGPYEWLASLEQSRRLSCCAGGLSHKGCGGMFTVRHWLENSGLELIDPLAGEISPAMTATVLRRDIFWAMAKSFGKTNFDGPLTMAEWCSGRVQSTDPGELADSLSSDLKASVMHVSGEHMGQPPNTSGPSGMVKANPSFSSHSRIDDGRHRRSGEESNLQVQGGIRNNERSATALPLPGILVGYQDDWLRTNVNMLRHWEKAPFEPFAVPKPISYHVVCLGLDPLLSAANIFFSQLSSVYEICGLGSHIPAGGGAASTGPSKGAGKSHPGFRVVDVPGAVKAAQNPLSLTSDYITCMDKLWSMMEFRKALRDVCRNMPLAGNCAASQRDPDLSTVVYVICPSSEPVEVLQTIIDSCHSLGAGLGISEGGLLYGSGSAGTVSIEEAASFPMVAFSVPRFALQVISADIILKISGHISCNPEILKDIAFTVYNKARRIPRRSAVEPAQNPVSRVRSAPGVMQSGATMPGMWKDCNTNRSTVTSMARDGALDSCTPRSWENQWQATRVGDGVGNEPAGQNGISSNLRYVYEPAFILSDSVPGGSGLDSQSNHPITAKDPIEKVGGGTSHPSNVSIAEAGSVATTEASETDNAGAGADLHCCYAWSEDWQWLVSVWTDARGELLDINVWPLAGVGGSSLQGLFLEVLQQGFLLLQSAVDAGSKKPRNIVISRLGGFTDGESQDWQSAILAVGTAGKNWAVQIKQPATKDSSQPSSRIFGLGSGTASCIVGAPGVRNKAFNYNKNDLILMKNNLQPQFEAVKGALQCVQSISLVSVRIEQALQVLCCSEFQSSGPPATVGIQPVTALASHKAALLFVPAHGIRFLSTTVMPQLSTEGEVPPIGQLLLQASKLTHPLVSAFIVAPAPPSIMTDRPSTLFVGLVSHFRSSNVAAQQDFAARGGLGSETVSGRKNSKAASASVVDGKEQLLEARRVLEYVAPQLQALTWLTASPLFLQRRSALPFHCDIAQKLRRLLSFMVLEGRPQAP